MSTFAIGDIHGCFDALIALIDAVQPGADDTLVFLGDYVDRGPESRGVIEWLLEESQRRELICLRGNHEMLMQAARDNPLMFDAWMPCGGRTTLGSYGWRGERNWQKLVPAAHWKFLESLAPWHETPGHIFVHAMAVPHLAMAEHDDFQLYWEKCHELPPHHSGKKVLVGHTRQTSGVPREFAGGVCIDTACIGGGWLTALDARTGAYHQASETGETRTGQLKQWGIKSAH